MKPLNTADRKKAFLTFLLFYIVSTLIIVITVYFGMRVPFKQNNRLKEQIAVLEREKEFSQDFAIKASEVRTQLDSVNRPGVQAAFVEGSIDENLKQLHQMVSSDSIAAKTLYQDMIQIANNLKEAKKQIRDAAGKDENLKQNLDQIETLRRDLNDCKTQYQLMLISQQR
jgi:small-conductance mechanosensitive channel